MSLVVTSARSPDTRPCDCYLCQYLRDNANKTNPHTENEQLNIWCNNWSYTVNVKDRLVPVHDMANAGAFALILNIGTRWRWVISFTLQLGCPRKSPIYPLNKRQPWILDCTTRRLVAVPTTLLQHPEATYPKNTVPYNALKYHVLETDQTPKFPVKLFAISYVEILYSVCNCVLHVKGNEYTENVCLHLWKYLTWCTSL